MLLTFCLESRNSRHVGDGNVHSLILFKDDEELEKVKEAVHVSVLSPSRSFIDELSD